MRTNFPCSQGHWNSVNPSPYLNPGWLWGAQTRRHLGFLEFSVRCCQEASDETYFSRVRSLSGSLAQPPGGFKLISALALRERRRSRTSASQSRMGPPSDFHKWCSDQTLHHWNRGCPSVARSNHLFKGIGSSPMPVMWQYWPGLSHLGDGSYPSPTFSHHCTG